MLKSKLHQITHPKYQNILPKIQTKMLHENPPYTKIFEKSKKIKQNTLKHISKAKNFSKILKRNTKKKNSSKIRTQNTI